jgi:hypothetical protein
MVKKLFLLIILILLYLPLLVSQDSIASRIVIFREPNYMAAALSYKVFINNQMVVKIRNNSYYEYYCSPGEYIVYVGQNSNNTIKIDLKEGETYYIKVGLAINFFAAIPEPIPVDRQWASETIARSNMKRINDSNSFWQRPKNRIGLNFNAGVGFKQIPMVTLTNGDNSNISFGGGFAIGLKYGYEFGKYFDLAAEINYQYSGLNPVIENGDVSFKRWNAYITPSLIIPIDGGQNMRLKLGGGLNYNISPVLNIDLNQIPDGFTDTWTYKDAMGYHFALTWELNYSDYFSTMIGLQYVNTQYEFKSSNSGNSPDLEFRRGNGQSLDLLMGLYYHF